MADEQFDFEKLRLERLKGAISPPDRPFQVPSEKSLTQPAFTEQPPKEQVPLTSAEDFEQLRLERLKAREQGINLPTAQERQTEIRQESLREGLRKQGFAVPEGAAFGTPGFEDFATRRDIALTDTFDEKRRVFLNRFPEGDFVSVAGRQRLAGAESPPSDTIMFRTHSNEPFREFDPGIGTRIELLGDLADMTADFGEGAVEIAASLGAKSIGVLMMRIAAGTVGFQALKESLQKLQGVSTETPEEVGSRTVGRTVLNVGGSVLFPGPLGSGAINIKRGAGIVATQPGTRAAQAAIKEVNVGLPKELQIPSMMAVQVARSPVLRLVGRQSAATIKTIGDRVHQQNLSTLAALSRLRDADLKRYADGQFDDLFDASSREILDLAKKHQTVRLDQGGELLQAGIPRWEDLSQTIVRAKYGQAEKLEPARYNLDSVRAVADEVQQGITGSSLKPVAAQNPVGFMGTGTPASVRRGTVQLENLSGAVLAEINKIKALDPTLPPRVNDLGQTVTSIDMLQALRTNLWELKTIPPGMNPTPDQRAAARQAGRLYDALTHTMRNPTNNNPAFAKAYQEASATAAKRFDTMEKIVMREVIKNETPTMLARRLTGPFQFDNLKILKDALTEHGPSQNWGLFQRSAEHHLLASNNIDNLTKNLKAFDEPTRNILFIPGRFEELQRIGQQWDTLNRAGFKEAKQQQAGIANQVTELTITNNTRDIETVVNSALKLPPEHSARKALRGGIIESVWNRAVKRFDDPADVGGVENARIDFDQKILIKEVKRVLDSDLRKVLTADDIKMFKNMEDIGLFLTNKPDPGTSIQAAETAKGLATFREESLYTLMHMIGIGRLMTNQSLQKSFLGTGAEKKFFPTVRVLGGVLAEISTDINATFDNTREP